MLLICLISLISFSFVSAIDCSSISGCNQFGNDLVCQFGTSQADDAYISSENPTLNYGTSTYLISKYNFESSIHKDIDFLYKINNLPVQATGDVLIGFSYSMSTESRTNFNLDVYQVTTSWVESSVNWNTLFPTTAYSDTSGKIGILVGKKSITNNPSDYDTYGSYTYFNITSIYKDWYSGTKTNNGILITYDLDLKDTTVTNSGTYLDSSELSDNEPKLIFSGVCTDDEEDGEEGISSEDETKFSIESGSICKEGGWIWLEITETGDKIEHYTTQDSWIWCAGADGIAGLVGGKTDDCCPGGYACVEGEPPGCKETDASYFSILSCEEYNNQSLLNDYNQAVDFDYDLEEFCVEDPFSVGKSGESGSGGIETTDDGIYYVEEQGAYITVSEDTYKCTWDTQTSKCVLEYGAGETIWHEDENPALFTCKKTFEKESLSDNKIKYKWTAIPTWNKEDVWFENLISELGSSLTVDEMKQAKLNAAGCIDGEKIIEHGGVKLSFFTLRNSIITICLIFIIYAIWSSLKNRNKKVERKVGRKRK